MLPEGPVAIRDQELGGDSKYLANALPVIELQLAKAGYRLAAWLDLIAATMAKNQEFDMGVGSGDL